MHFTFLNIKKAYLRNFRHYVYVFDFVWRETLPTLYDLSQQTSSFKKGGKFLSSKAPFFPQSRCNLVTKAMCGKNTDFYTLYLTTLLYCKVPLLYVLHSSTLLYSSSREASCHSRDVKSSYRDQNDEIGGF